MFRKILLPIDVAEPEIAKEAIEAATTLAKAFDSQLRLIHVTSPVVVASPMAVIPQAVYDELGVGAHKRSMATYLLGSSAAAIVRHAGCTVMVVRSGKKATLL